MSAALPTQHSKYTHAHTHTHAHAHAHTRNAYAHAHAHVTTVVANEEVRTLGVSITVAANPVFDMICIYWSSYRKLL